MLMARFLIRCTFSDRNVLVTAPGLHADDHDAPVNAVLSEVVVRADMRPLALVKVAARLD